MSKYLGRADQRLRKRIWKSLERQGLVRLKVLMGELILPRLEVFGNEKTSNKRIEQAVIKAIPGLLAKGIIVPDS